MNQYPTSMDSPQTNLMLRVIRAIGENALLEGNEKVLIAVSGGADSTALFDVLVKIRSSLGFTLGVAHLDHGLRGMASKEDRAFVEQLARQSGIPCYSEYRDVNAFQKQHRLSLEDAARRVRYTFLFETAEKHGFSKIATAHHADDNAELVMMNILRGSGPAGLSGMAATSRNGRLIRPLIGISRSDIMDYVFENNLAYRDDASNRDQAMLRNRVRHDLLPHIEKNYQKGAARNLCRTAGIIRDDEDWLDGIVEPFFKQALSQESASLVSLRIPALESLHVALRRRLIRKAIRHVKGNLRRITLHHVDQAIRLLHKGSGRFSLDFPDRIRVKKKGDNLVIVQELQSLRQVSPFCDNSSKDFAYRVDKPLVPDMAVDVPEAGLCLRFSAMAGPLSHEPVDTDPKTVYMDLNRLVFPLVIRSIQPGDRFRPLGMDGHQRVSRFFIHRKIPAEHRKTIPVLVSNGEIVWVCGHRIDDSVKLLPETENILKIELLLA